MSKKSKHDFIENLERAGGREAWLGSQSVWVRALHSIICVMLQQDLFKASLSEFQQMTSFAATEKVLSNSSAVLCRQSWGGTSNSVEDARVCEQSQCDSNSVES